MSDPFHFTNRSTLKKVFAVTAIVLMVVISVPLTEAAPPAPKTICHATGSGTYQQLHVNENALNGHFENNGTPLFGHEDDLRLDGHVTCPTEAPTDTPDEPILGCTDEGAINFNPLATEDDDTCEYEQEEGQVPGCMNPEALNFNPSATQDDGSCAYPEILGSIRICKIIVNHEDVPVSGSTLGSTTFTISGFTPAVSSNPAPITEFGTTNFATALSYNTDLIPSSPGDDAECHTISNLPLGGYYYGEEEITGAGSWLTPTYNDQYESVIEDLDDFYPYDSNLFDGDASNDGEREQDADGHLNLTESRPDRTIVLLNRLPEEFPGSITVCKVVEDNTVEPGTTFTVAGVIPPVSSVATPVGNFGSAVFTLPLTLNTDLLSDIPGDDAECKTFNNLPLGGYHYDRESIDGPGIWEDPRYNDQYNNVLSTLADFFLWDGNLYDGNSSNDLPRNENADGHLNLTEGRPHRTIVVYNRLSDEECQGDCGQTVPECDNQFGDCTPPISHFDGNPYREHETILNTELLPLTLSGGSDDELSGVQSAELHIHLMGDAELVDGEEYGTFFESLDCTDHGTPIETEIISLSLQSVNPIPALNTTWSYEWLPSKRGIYCIEAHATDAAGNVEHTAFGGPISILAQLPVSTPTPTPTPTPNGGGGGGGGGGSVLFNTPTPQPSSATAGAATPTPTPAGEVLGATTTATLPATGASASDLAIIVLFGLMTISGALMVLSGYGIVPIPVRK